MAHARKKVWGVAAVGIVVVAAVAFFVFTSSASREAAALYGVWRVTGNIVNGHIVADPPGETCFVRFSKNTLTPYFLVNGELWPSNAMTLTWGFQDGKLCCYETDPRHRSDRSFLERLFDPDPVDVTQHLITVTDADTIRLESTSTMYKSGGSVMTVTDVTTLARSSQAELEAAITKRLTPEDFAAQRQARAAALREANENEPTSHPADEPANETDPLEPVE